MQEEIKNVNGNTSSRLMDEVKRSSLQLTMKRIKHINTTKARINNATDLDMKYKANNAFSSKSDKDFHYIAASKRNISTSCR